MTWLAPSPGSIRDDRGCGKRSSQAPRFHPGMLGRRQVDRGPHRLGGQLRRADPQADIPLLRDLLSLRPRLRGPALTPARHERYQESARKMPPLPGAGRVCAEAGLPFWPASKLGCTSCAGTTPRSWRAASRNSELRSQRDVDHVSKLRLAPDSRTPAAAEDRHSHCHERTRADPSRILVPVYPIGSGTAARSDYLFWHPVLTR
jgi:hypothetical protein